MKVVVILVLLVGCCSLSHAQSFKSTRSETTFFSSAPLEDIKATNTKATSLFNGETGAIAFFVPIKAFQFSKSLMQQHYNERFMESNKYPQATFEGKLTGYDLDVSGVQEALAVGKMTIHGVSRDVKIKGQFTHGSGRVKMESKFPIKVADYDIDIPKVVFYNIAEEVEVTVLFIYEEF
ncbi:MAG: YceI family protein [Anditalea sp.]